MLLEILLLEGLEGLGRNVHMTHASDGNQADLVIQVILVAIGCIQHNLQKQSRRTPHIHTLQLSHPVLTRLIRIQI